MDISKPMVSRLLGNLAQYVHKDDRLNLIKDAKKSKNMKEFLSYYKNYRKK